MTLLQGLTCSSLLVLSILSRATARDTTYISGTSITGVTQQLAVDRTPALYTGAFGDCLGGRSLFNITKFDAAYYVDNSTVLFHLDGHSMIKNESLMMHFSMDAYGENRFQMTFNPCLVNIGSLCPLNASVPVTGWAVFPIGPQQVGDIPSLAFTIPDFEGSVRLQIFGNSTQSEIGCFQATLTNGNTMAYPRVISPILAAFVLAAMIASFAAAVYGPSITAMRTHYAHSLSVVVVFEAFQSIFFSGALQLDFPSVLPAWWSNFAWSAGQIYSASVVRTANLSSGLRGNLSQVGDTGSANNLTSDTGAALIQQIYGRSILVAPDAAHQLLPRYNESDPYDYTWAGSQVSAGVALPGNWTGFPGTLAALNLPAADTFAIGLIWLLVMMSMLISLLALLKLCIESLVKIKGVEEDRLTYFREHWVQYIIVTVLRTLFGAFAMITTLAFYQFSSMSSRGSTALAAIFFLVFFLGIGGLAAHACYVRLKEGRYVVEPDRIVFVRDTIWKFVPCIVLKRRNSLEQAEKPARAMASLPFVQIQYHDYHPDRVTVHRDEHYTKRFGWLSARYRRTRWWFFACYLGYHLFRAALVGGGSATPMAQVYCLLIYDIATFVALVTLDPFEGRRNAALAVWMLGISKILTTGLSVSFLPAMNVNRIVATAIGIIIVVIQGLLTLGVMVLVVLSAVSSHMSLMRNQAQYRPVGLAPTSARYLAHLERQASDVRMSRAERARLEREAVAESTAPVVPSFSVRSVRRVSKIYDEDEATLGGGNNSVHHQQQDGLAGARPKPSYSRTASIRSSRSGLPRGARKYRASWSSQDFAEWDALSRSGEGAGDRVLSAARRLSSYSAYYAGSTLDTFSEEDATEAEWSLSSSGASAELRRPTTPTTVSSGPSGSSRTAVNSPEPHVGNGKESMEEDAQSPGGYYSLEGGSPGQQPPAVRSPEGELPLRRCSME